MIRWGMLLIRFRIRLGMSRGIEVLEMLVQTYSIAKVCERSVLE
jgi:hypothetical protein